MADTLRDAALAYSPGVAEACLTIVDNPHEAAQLMSRAKHLPGVRRGCFVTGANIAINGGQHMQ